MSLWNFKKLASKPMNTVKRKFIIEGENRAKKTKILEAIYHDFLKPEKLKSHGTIFGDLHVMGYDRGHKPDDWILEEKAKENLLGISTLDYFVQASLKVQSNFT